MLACFSNFDIRARNLIAAQWMNKTKAQIPPTNGSLSKLWAIMPYDPLSNLFVTPLGSQKCHFGSQMEKSILLSQQDINYFFVHSTSAVMGQSAILFPAASQLWLESSSRPNSAAYLTASTNTDHMKAEAIGWPLSPRWMEAFIESVTV